MRQREAIRMPSAGLAVGAATDEDEDAFSELIDAHRQELQVHCHRMLRSVEDAEDMVQETFLRAWRSRGTYQGRSSVRAWLYRIATNVCLNALERRRHRPQGALRPDVAEIEAPDQSVAQIAATDAEPDAAIVAKETFELVFLVALRLPPRQGAALILRCVGDLSAKETASLLEANVPSVNSALQRARRTLRDHLPEQRLAWRGGSDPIHEERVLIRRLIGGIESSDTDVLVQMSRRRWAAGRSTRRHRRGDPT